MAYAALPGLWQTRTAPALSSTKCTRAQVSVNLAALSVDGQQCVGVFLCDLLSPWASSLMEAALVPSSARDAQSAACIQDCWSMGQGLTFQV